jgi:hypothetical protein
MSMLASLLDFWVLSVLLLKLYPLEVVLEACLKMDASVGSSKANLSLYTEPKIELSKFELILAKC